MVVIQLQMRGPQETIQLPQEIRYRRVRVRLLSWKNTTNNWERGLLQINRSGENYALIGNNIYKCARALYLLPVGGAVASYEPTNSQLYEIELRETYRTTSLELSFLLCKALDTPVASTDVSGTNPVTMELELLE
jgi:hypothetical protein